MPNSPPHSLQFRLPPDIVQCTTGLTSGGRRSLEVASAATARCPCRPIMWNLRCALRVPTRREDACAAELPWISRALAWSSREWRRGQRSALQAAPSWMAFRSVEVLVVVRSRLRVSRFPGTAPTTRSRSSARRESHEAWSVEAAEHPCRRITLSSTSAPYAPRRSTSACTVALMLHLLLNQCRPGLQLISQQGHRRRRCFSQMRPCRRHRHGSQTLSSR
mmetsp:Transcript_9871/g.18066  ORF Transcript_9871/g.18066 Transcript_9871/m.18066 type:complete len:220 (+) Transcript_9871:226-885(+)